MKKSVFSILLLFFIINNLIGDDYLPEYVYNDDEENVPEYIIKYLEGESPIYEGIYYSFDLPIYDNTIPDYPIPVSGKLLIEEKIYIELYNLYPSEMENLKKSGYDLSDSSQSFFVETQGFTKLVVFDSEDKIICLINLKDSVPPPVFIP